MLWRAFDAHCHTYGAEDMPIYGFLNKVYLNQNADLRGDVRRRLAKLLSEVVTLLAPSAKREKRKIRQLLKDYQSKDVDLDKLLDDTYDVPEDDEPTEKIYIDQIEIKINELAKSKEDTDALLLDYLKSQSGYKSTMKIVYGDCRELAERLLNGKTKLSDCIRLIFNLLKYRYKITRKHIRTYKPGECRDFKLCPLLIDFDYWVGDKSEASITDQIELMELNKKLNKGALFPFVPFNPWREIANNGNENGSLHIIKEAISRHGFYGVKIYPPMGFRPLGNSGLSQSQFPDNCPDNFGEKIDIVLNELYAYCVEENVPITTHCSNSNGAGVGYAMRGHPKYWDSVADRYPKLRINLGHFYGSWYWDIFQLITKHENVYTDISYSPAVLNNGYHEYLIAALKKFIDKDDKFKDRLMYGSDWVMLSLEENRKEYLDACEHIYSSAVDGNEEDIYKFFYNNAEDFIGPPRAE